MFWDLLKKIPSGLSDIGKLSAVLAAAFGAATDGKMWRSLGWLLLGLALIVLAITWLIRGPLEAKAAQAGKLAALVA